VVWDPGANYSRGPDLAILFNLYLESLRAGCPRRFFAVAKNYKSFSSLLRDENFRLFVTFTGNCNLPPIRIGRKKLKYAILRAEREPPVFIRNTDYLSRTDWVTSVRYHGYQSRTRNHIGRLAINNYAIDSARELARHACRTQHANK
jgi:hypothetical protein